MVINFIKFCSFIFILFLIDSSASAPASAPSKQSSKPVEKPTTEGDDDVEAHKDNNRGGHSRGKDSHQRSNRSGKPGRGHEGGEGDETSRRPKREFDRRSATGRYDPRLRSLN